MFCPIFWGKKILAGTFWGSQKAYPSVLWVTFWAVGLFGGLVLPNGTGFFFFVEV